MSDIAVTAPTRFSAVNKKQLNLPGNGLNTLIKNYLIIILLIVSISLIATIKMPEFKI